MKNRTQSVYIFLALMILVHINYATLERCTTPTEDHQKKEFAAEKKNTQKLVQLAFKKVDTELKAEKPEFKLIDRLLNHVDKILLPDMRRVATADTQQTDVQESELQQAEAQFAVLRANAHELQRKKWGLDTLGHIISKTAHEQAAKEPDIQVLPAQPPLQRCRNSSLRARMRFSKSTIDLEEQINDLAFVRDTLDDPPIYSDDLLPMKRIHTNFTNACDAHEKYLEALKHDTDVIHTPYYTYQFCKTRAIAHDAAIQTILDRIKRMELLYLKLCPNDLARQLLNNEYQLYSFNAKKPSTWGLYLVYGSHIRRLYWGLGTALKDTIINNAHQAHICELHEETSRLLTRQVQLLQKVEKNLEHLHIQKSQQLHTQRRVYNRLCFDFRKLNETFAGLGLPTRKYVPKKL